MALIYNSDRLGFVYPDLESGTPTINGRVVINVPKGNYSVYNTTVNETYQAGDMQTAGS
jgi:hypothetical protein